MAALGEGLNLLFALGFVGVIIAVAGKRLWKTDREVADGPRAEAYKIFTTAFDVELRQADLERRLMSASPDYANGFYQAAHDAWNAAIARSWTIHDAARLEFERVADSLAQTRIANAFKDSAVTFLIDQSGSMKGEPIAHAAAMIRWIVPFLEQHGARVEVVGFSTAGWRGGFAYQKWLAFGRPKRPGRLCALSYTICKTHGEVASADAYDALLNPNLLRENVDGEAILWAAERLKLQPQPRHILIVVSDGAPVDDATLTTNGPSYLHRHLMTVIEGLAAESIITLAAIGINHRVADWYALSTQAEVLDDLPMAAGELLAKITSDH